METLRVECLSCGARRIVVIGDDRPADPGECQRCGYVGWARSDDLDAVSRRQLRERPIERRRLRLAGW